MLLEKNARLLRPDCIDLGNWAWIKDGATFFGAGNLHLGDSTEVCEHASIWERAHGANMGSKLASTVGTVSEIFLPQPVVR